MAKNNSDTMFEYSTLNEIVEYGMKAEKREYLYKNLWIEKELTVFFESSIVYPLSPPGGAAQAHRLHRSRVPV